MSTFDPFANGKASWSSERDQITGTFALRADLGLTLENVEVVDGVFVVCTFAVDDESSLRGER